ncbi:hypothetical protein EXIGLDRAFT_276172 [Exidia glandulosa HHB12029]|uniref:DH domain-containing protein n=1 Tax=Exidia glandulosa HHB12029 TaxID=1314781 RepID=A0A165M8R9_EXIGL|nr:hypothetical protein EXIGLDRAFT_276172 [Exidia glandulosa HHB12029]
MDERFANDYLPNHEIRDEDLPPTSEDRHDQIDDSVHEAFADEMHTLSKSAHAPPPLQSESDMSSLGSMNQKAWSAVTAESQLSHGAETLFKHLQSPDDDSSSRAPPAPPHNGSPMLGQRTPTQQERTPTADDTWSEITGNSGNVRYVESEADDEESAPDFANRRRTWRSTIAHAAYDSLLERHGAQEMQRQELIWEICESEQAFVRDMRSVLRTFVQPLRTQDRRWIPGVPNAVMRLFDWLDDIVQLHSQMFSALHAARSKQYPIVTYIAETLRPFVPRLELHQPFLARLDAVSRTIDDLVDNPHNDFGEFVRMQAQLPEWSGATLTSALRRPATHFTSYPSQFQVSFFSYGRDISSRSAQKLWQCTPRSHLDHLPTFSLYHSTDMIVRVMLEVCSREEEYERVKNVASRISGLPHNFVLARRERRLVAQGLLRRVHLSDQERGILEGEEPVAEESVEMPLCMPILSPQYHNARSWESPSSTSWLRPSPPAASPWHDSRPLSMVSSSSSFCSSFTSDMEEEHPRSKAHRNGTSALTSRNGKAKDALVYVFVFTDLVLLAHRTEARDEYEQDTWHLVEDVGMVRVLGVTDHSGKLDYEQLISLDVLPMPQEHAGVNVASKDCVACPVYLSLSERATPRLAPARLLEEAKQQWMQAFHKCFMFTLRSLAFPCHSGMDLAHGPTADYEMDTKMSVMSILSSGLPLPKSPSQLLDQHDRGRPPDAVEEEREERGWWAVRFRQVLREMQRQDLPFPAEQAQGDNAVAPMIKRSRSTTPGVDNRRRSVMTSRPLLLSATSSSIMLTPATPRKERANTSSNPATGRGSTSGPRRL